MSTTAPHFLLLSDTNDSSDIVGSWSFVLERVNGSGRIEVSDNEPDVRGERLKLLAVVRGLEALEQPSKVTLITPSRFIGRGIRKGISLWKEQSWQWERYGVMVDVKNADLWKRIDRAKVFHSVECRVWNFGAYLESLNEGHQLIGARMKNSLNTIEKPKAPRIRRPKSERTEPSASLTELATAVATKLSPVQTVNESQAYGCA